MIDHMTTHYTVIAPQKPQDKVGTIVVRTEAGQSVAGCAGAQPTVVM
jgi:hypothetical protein